jgi:hypothetical protein
MIRSVRSWCSKVIISSPLIPDNWLTHSVSLPFLPSCLPHSLWAESAMTPTCRRETFVTVISSPCLIGILDLVRTCRVPTHSPFWGRITDLSSRESTPEFAATLIGSYCYAIPTIYRDWVRLSHFPIGCPWPRQCGNAVVPFDRR